MARLCDAMGWSAVCDCGISWSYLSYFHEMVRRTRTYLVCISLTENCFYFSTVHTIMKCNVLRHLFWLFTVYQSTHLRVSSISKALLCRFHNMHSQVQLRELFERKMGLIVKPSVKTCVLGSSKEPSHRDGSF